MSYAEGMLPGLSLVPSVTIPPAPVAILNAAHRQHNAHHDNPQTDDESPHLPLNCAISEPLLRGAEGGMPVGVGFVVAKSAFRVCYGVHSITSTARLGNGARTHGGDCNG